MDKVLASLALGNHFRAYRLPYLQTEDPSPLG